MSKQILTCTVSQRPYTVPEDLKEFLSKALELNPNTGARLPQPNICPSEQLRMMSAYGNFCHLFRTKSILSGQPLLTRFRPDYGLKITTTDEFWSDQVDNTQFGRGFDFSRPFFEQWHDLFKVCYLLPLNSGSTENSDYVNGARDVKDCYLSFVIFNCEACIYCYEISHSSFCMDCVSTGNSQYCYSCAEAYQCYECFYGFYLSDCSECIACSDCRSCTNCIGCIGLERASYCIFNERVTPEEYQNFRSQIFSGERQALETFLLNAQQFHAAQNHNMRTIINCEESSGAYLRHSRRLTHCYSSTNCEDCGYLIGANGLKNAWFAWAMICEQAYMCAGNNMHNCYFCYQGYGAESCWYSYLINANCSNCFGCVGLKKKSYCILNREYSKEEYFDLIPRIVSKMQSTGEWGQFFPRENSPHPYEDCWANWHIEPESLDVLKLRGYRIQDETPVSAAVVRRQITPESSRNIKWGEISKQTFHCLETGKPFTLQKREFDYYQRYSLPFPCLHWETRLLKVMGRKKKFPLNIDHDLQD